MHPTVFWPLPMRSQLFILLRIPICDELLLAAFHILLFFLAYDTLVLMCLDVGLFEFSFLDFIEILVCVGSCLLSHLRGFRHYLFKYSLYCVLQIS